MSDENKQLLPQVRAPHVHTKEVIEALAIQEGCLLAKDMGLSHIVIESDVQSVIQAVQMGRYEGPSVGNIIQSIVELLSSFPQGQIKYCPR
uniref:RNase H type-1 domain-containing protein n=1 Tax=Fagus sylvatica TaxID=28930 RepID=A0A2N9HUH9_FAGSY